MEKAREKAHRSIFARVPHVPDSLRSDSVELTELRNTQQSRAYSYAYLTPYLSLRSRLSQIWINRWTVLLLLVLVRVVLLIANLNDNIGDAKIKALSACSKVEDIGSAMASMPHYLSVGVNELSATGIEKVVDGMVKALQLAVTIIEHLILFVINMMTSTYVCLATALIHGGLDVAGEVTKKVTDALNSAVSGIAKSIENDSKSIQDKVNSLANKIDSSIFGGILPDIPKVDFGGAVNDLKNVKVDTSGFVSDLDKLNNKIPTFDQVKNFTDHAISFPFELIKKTINDSYGAYTFDRNVFPVAQKQQLSFCSNNENINNFFKGLYETANVAKITFIVLLSVLAILAMAPMAWLEIKRWRRQQKHAKIMKKNQYDAMDVVYLSSRPVSATWGIKIASRFKGKRQILVRWCVAYATSLPALFVLSLAIAGFFSCLCQFIMLKAIEKKVPELAQQVGNFAEDVVTTLEGVSEKWAVDANNVIIDFNDDINKDILGYVTNGTSAVNTTLNTFTDEMQKGLDTLFGDTILKKPIEDVIRCLVGLKVEAVQKGLTWVHDQAHVTFPLFANDTFSLGAAKSIDADSDLTTFLASPSTVTTDEVTGAITHVTNALHNNIIQEALISTALLLVYILVVLIGVVRALAGMVTPDKNRGDGGGHQYTGDDRPPVSPRGSPSHSEKAAARFGPFGESDNYHDEKLMSTVQGGKARPVKGHVRSSSHGRFDVANKF